MATSRVLRERDLRALAAVIEDGLRDDPGPAMPWAVLDRLQRLIPCDTIQWDELATPVHERLTGQLLDRGHYSADADADEMDREPRFWALRAEFLPHSYRQRTGDLISVIRWSDFYSTSQLKNDPFYAEYMTGNNRRKYALDLQLPSQPGRTRRLGFWRDNRDFSERDRIVLQLLRPHLHEVYLDAERRRRGIPNLSPREREVLQLASQGYSNADIARVLYISVSTVAKHMEHIFDRTGVRTRGAAAALALPQVSAFTGPRPDTRQ